MPEEHECSDRHTEKKQAEVGTRGCVFDRCIAWFHRGSLVLFGEANIRCKATTQRIFCNGNPIGELLQVMRAARFATQTTHFETAEGVALDDGAGAASVDVKITHLEVLTSLSDPSGGAGEETGSEGVRRCVDPFDGLLKGFGAHDSNHGPKDLFVGDAMTGVDVFDDGRWYKVAAIGSGCLGQEDSFCLGDVDVVSDSLTCLLIDDRT